MLLLLQRRRRRAAGGKQSFLFLFSTRPSIVNRWKEHLFDLSLNGTARGKLKVYLVWLNLNVLLECAFFFFILLLLFDAFLYLNRLAFCTSFFQSTQCLFSSLCMHDELCGCIETIADSIKWNKSLNVTIEQYYWIDDDGYVQHTHSSWEVIVWNWLHSLNENRCCLLSVCRSLSRPHTDTDCDCQPHRRSIDFSFASNVGSSFRDATTK